MRSFLSRSPLSGRSRLPVLFRPTLFSLEDRWTPANFAPTDVSSLIANLTSANSNGEADVFDLGGLTFTLTAVDNTTLGQTGLPVILADGGNGITINGNGATITRDTATPAFRLFGVGTGATLTLQQLTLSNGLAQGGDGGTGTNTNAATAGGGGGAGLGGAVYVAPGGTLNLVQSVLSGNLATGGAGGAAANIGQGNFSGGGGGSAAFDGGNVTVQSNVGGGGGGMNGPGGDATAVNNGGQGGLNEVGGQAAGGVGAVAGANGTLGGGGGGGGASRPGGNGLGTNSGGFGGGGGGGSFNGGAPVASGGAGGFGAGGGGAGGQYLTAPLNPAGAGGFGGGGGGAAGNGSYVGLGAGLGGFGGGDGVSGGGGGAGLGGAVFNNGGTVTITNCTISGNSAAGGLGGAAGGGTAGTAGDGLGGAIFNRNGTLTILNSTISGNTAPNGGRDVYNLSDGAGNTGTANITNSILGQSGSTAVTNFNSASINGGNAPVNTGLTNLMSNRGTFPSTGVIAATDPQLGALADNGGPTQTLALLPGSPAIRAGTSAGAPVTDQRGFARNGAIDIGAFQTASPNQNAQPTYAVGAGPGGPGAVTVYNADGTVSRTVSPFPDGNGARAITTDVNGDGTADTVVTTGPGVRVRVAVVDGKTGTVTTFDAFEDTFTGGAFVAAGDLDGDGKAEIAVSADTTGSARASVFTNTGTVLADFFGIDDPNFRGGSRVAFGDLNDDGTPDLIVAAGTGGGPRIAVYDGKTVIGTFAGQPQRLIGDFFAFEEALRNGSYVSAGDVNGDGFSDLIFGGGPDGAPRVRIADGKALLTAGDFGSLDNPDAASLTIGNFFAGGSAFEVFRQGVVVVAKDLDGDAFADLVAGVPTDSGSTVFTYPGKTLLGTSTPPVATDFDVFPDLLTGVFVG